MLKTLASACVLAVLAFTSTPAHAQTFDNRTYFTFDQPITLPGVTLPAGTYLFRNPDITSRRVVQVLSGDGKQSYALLLTIPALRPEPADQPEIRFMETPEGAPAAIKAWWYPGNTIGWEFIYPEEQALKLAKAGEASGPAPTIRARRDPIRPRPTTRPREWSQGANRSEEHEGSAAGMAPSGECRERGPGRDGVLFGEGWTGDADRLAIPRRVGDHEHHDVCAAISRLQGDPTLLALDVVEPGLGFHVQGRPVLESVDVRVPGA